MKKIIILGASGMVGGELMKLALESSDISEVIILSRKSIGISHDKLTELVLEDFKNYDSVLDHLSNIDAAFFCIGVYTGAVSREKFREITIDYPVNFAKALIDKSPNATFCLLSGAGADREEKSRMIFAMDKGIAENQLSKIGFKRFHSFRPGYIYPVEPRNEPNFSYRLFRALYPVFKLLGKKYSITSVQLAQGMLDVSSKKCDLEVLENEDILKWLDD